MSTDVKLPSLGENIESGDVVKILVSEGEEIDSQQTIIELETDKAIVEVPAGASGVVEEIQIKAGDKVSIGQTILTLAESGKKPDRKEVLPAPPTRTESSPAKAAKPEKAAKPSRPGKPAREARPPGEVVDFSRRPAAEQGPPDRSVIPASPSVRRLAREIGVDIAEINGSGPQGRISPEDVKAYSRELHQTPRAVRQAATPEAALPDFSRWGEVEVQSFTNVRRKTAEHMARSWTSVPHVTQHDECDITRLEQLRRAHSGDVEKAGGKLTVTAIVLKFAAAALRVFPQFNASIDTVREEVVLKKYIHIGVAVDTPRGLLVPVVRDVDQKNISAISVELLNLAERARSGKLSLEEMQGGTFTITNLGGIGGTSFTPIVNWPEVAILGLSRSAERPVYREGSVVPRFFLPMSLSYDHRLIDGADAARFLRWLAQALEEPFILSLEG